MNEPIDLTPIRVIGKRLREAAEREDAAAALAAVAAASEIVMSREHYDHDFVVGRRYRVSILGAGDMCGPLDGAADGWPKVIEFAKGWERATLLTFEGEFVGGDAAESAQTVGLFGRRLTFVEDNGNIAVCSAHDMIGVSEC